MRASKATKGWKTLEDEREAGAPDFGSSLHSNPNLGSDVELRTAALATPLSTETTSSAGAPTISNPIIVNAFDTTAFGNPDPSGLAFIPAAAPEQGRCWSPTPR